MVTTGATKLVPLLQLTVPMPLSIVHTAEPAPDVVHVRLEPEPTVIGPGGLAVNESIVAGITVTVAEAVPIGVP